MNAKRLARPTRLRRLLLLLLAVTSMALLVAGSGWVGERPAAAQDVAHAATSTPKPVPSTTPATPAPKADPCSGVQILLPHCTVREVGQRATNVAANALNKGLLTPLSALIIAATETLLGIFLRLWLTLSSFDLHQQGAMSLYGMTMAIGMMIAVLLLIWQAIRTMVQGKGLPLLEALQGLVITGLVSLCGVAVTGGVMRASDLLSEWILGDLVRNGLLNKQITAMTLSTGLPAWLTIQVATLLILVLIIQIIVLWLRNATIPILALMLPIAAAGSIGTNATRAWLPKTITAILTVAAYKPIVSLIIVSAVAQFRDSTEVAGLVYALIMFVAAVIAMPALVKIFAPLGLAAGGSGAGSWLSQAGWMAASRLGGRGNSGGGGSGGDGSGGAAPMSVIEHEQRMEHSQASQQRTQQSTEQHSASHSGATPGMPQASADDPRGTPAATGNLPAGATPAGGSGATAHGQAGATATTAGSAGTGGAAGASSAAGVPGPAGAAAGVALEGAERLGQAAAGHVSAPEQAAEHAGSAASAHPLERTDSDGGSGAGPIVDRNYG
ncbi:hypothetical protein [Nonomuraea ceibae]|uniref:hypothetical protein n=1 Tax=Nonomuraea ceibae TaxID=1935170 RepID=UPI001C5D2D29|nr:hypothetical protein [Nonomuraea ceibae]